MIFSCFVACAVLLSPADAPARDTVVHFTSGAITLEGTLTLPTGPGPWPAAVIIAGSGPTDRNGNTAIAGVNPGSYRLIAEGLAERGIATLRYDKRVLPTARGTTSIVGLTLQDFAVDAAAAAAFLRARADVRGVTLIGHSEGGSLAMMAAKASPSPAGLVLVSAAGRDLTTIIHEQLSRQFPADAMARFDTAWAAYIKGEPVKAPAGMEVLFVPINRPFMASWQAIRPVELLRGIAVPTLVLQGETDLQVTEADARLLASARPDVKLVLMPGVNHVLKLSSGTTIPQQMPVYADSTLPLAPAVVPAIAGFILALKPSP